MKDIDGKDFLTFNELTPKSISELIRLAESQKAVRKEFMPSSVLKGKSVALIFEKPSTRTRVSFEVGISQLGGTPVILNGSDMQLGRGETIPDTGRVLSRYVDAIVIRSYSHSEVEQLARASDVPVINALTDDYHPCQILADLFTIFEVKGVFKGLKLAYLGDGNNIANTLLIGCSKVGIDISVATPKGYEPLGAAVETAKSNAASSGSKVEILNDPREAARDADVLYTDVWVSMGQEEEAKKRLDAFKGFSLDENIASLAKTNHTVMHCLPAHRGQEISASVADGPHSVIFDQAENRLHSQKALLIKLLT